MTESEGGIVSSAGQDAVTALQGEVDQLLSSMLSGIGMVQLYADDRARVEALQKWRARERAPPPVELTTPVSGTLAELGPDDMLKQLVDSIVTSYQGCVRLIDELPSADSAEDQMAELARLDAAHRDLVDRLADRVVEAEKLSEQLLFAQEELVKPLEADLLLGSKS